MKRLLILLMAIMCTLSSMAYDVCVDGFYYELDNTYNTAILTNGSSTTGSYSGDVVIPSSFEYSGKQYTVNCIGMSAFSRCYSLTSLTIPSSVTWIYPYAFDGCSNLARVYITNLSAWCKMRFDSNPLYYAQHLYLNGTEVKDLIIPNSVTSISPYAFNGFKGLTSVSIGECSNT